MLELYWVCLWFGILFTLIVVIFGDLLGDLWEAVGEFFHLDGPGFFQPIVLVGGITAFGGAGVLLTRYAHFSPAWTLVLSILTAAALSFLAYFFYVKPMEHAENSIAFSEQDLIGKIGEVTVPIPRNGYGEVVIGIGGGRSNQIAASFEGEEIQAGTRVVVIEVKDHAVYVSRFDQELE